MTLRPPRTLRGGRFGIKGMFLTDALLSCSYPQSCRICGRSVERQRYGVACEGCWKTQIVTDEADHQALGWYEGALRETVLLLKRQPYLPQHVAVDCSRASKLERRHRIVPVPLHEERLRSRGFNQAAVIGRELSRALRLPLDEVSLIRVSASEKYRTGLDAKGARTLFPGPSRCVSTLNRRRTHPARRRRFHHGATVGACEAALIEAGAKSVSILTLARAQYSKF